MKLVFTILMLFFYFGIWAQNADPIVINQKNTSLNSILIELRENHDVKFAYNAELIAQYLVSVSDTFPNATKAIEKLLANTDLEFELTDGVFIIVPQKKLEKKKPIKKLTFKGVILDAFTKEPLPYSHIQINRKAIVSDIKGSFTYFTENDTLLRIRVSHLGYFIEDTTITSNAFCTFLMLPASEKLNEILVASNPIQKATLIGDKAGKMKVNHTISRFMPGNGDNSVYNLLRVMPGIQATGEQSSNLLIWGSYTGQSQVTFDGFTLFPMKNYNDNLGMMNPLVVKSIDVHKGGYDASIGNRVGGVVDIIGKNGNTQKTTIGLNISNTSINGMVEIPLFNRKAALLLAHRRTYYNLYSSDDFNIYSPLTRDKSDETNPLIDVETDLNVSPKDYSFHDTNIKYSYHFDNGNMLFISLYGAKDNFDLSVEKPSILKNIRERKWVYNPQKQEYQYRWVKQEFSADLQLNDIDENRQKGASLYYDVNWKNGVNSSFTFSSSNLERFNIQKSGFIISAIDSINVKERMWTQNQVLERSFKNTNNIRFNEGHHLKIGTGGYLHHTDYSFKRAITDSLGINDTISEGYDLNAGRIFVFMDDVLPIGTFLKFKGGLRVNYTLPENQFYFEPRLSFEANLDPIKINIAWGRYMQFLNQAQYVDNLNNYYYYWITHNQFFPVVKSSHWVGGISYFKNDLTINIDAYHKATSNMIRSRYTPTLNTNKRYRIDGKSYGIDVYLKKEFKRLTMWGSYTCAKALEKETRLDRTEELQGYIPAPQDQRHEAKGAIIYQLGSFYFSANYIYGSGIQIIKDALNESLSDVSYHRMDAALLYKFNPGSIRAELGFSILNVFNSQNFKYSNIKRVRITPSQQLLIYANAVPFTPALHLKINW